MVFMGKDKKGKGKNKKFFVKIVEYEDMPEFWEEFRILTFLSGLSLVLAFFFSAIEQVNFFYVLGIIFCVLILLLLIVGSVIRIITRKVHWEERNIE